MATASRKEQLTTIISIITPGCVRSSVRLFVRLSVRTCEKRKRKPHAHAPGCTCDQFTVTGQSTTCLYVKCEKMLALSSDYKT